MRPLFRKNLTRIVILLCAVVLFSFASILLNGTIFFVSPSVEKKSVHSSFDDLIIGETKLRRVGKRVVWVTLLSAMQKSNMQQLTAGLVDHNEGCDLSQVYCVLLADTKQSGISLRYTAAAPPQLPNTVPWFGGFVNPTNGAVYDLLGRAYLYQGKVDVLLKIQSNN